MPASKPSKPTKEIGASGVNISNGVIIGEDYNPKLSATNANRIWDEMSKNDASVNSALEAMKQPIRSADFTIDPASEDAADQEVAEFIKDCLFHVVDWEQFLDEALTYLEFGHDVHEMVFEPRDINGQPRIALTKLGYRKQTTISRWAIGVDNLPGITQLLPDGKLAEIPEDRLVRFTHRQRGDNYVGISILRTAYKHWYIKDKLYRIDAVGHERQALGVVDIAYPPGAKAEDKTKMTKAARNLRASEQGYLMHPKEWEVGFMDMKGGTLRDMMPSINHHDRQISKNMLVQFLEIGAAGGGGTRSTSEDQSKLFEMAVNAVAHRIVYIVQNTIVRTLVDLNFTDREYPTLRVENISDDNIPVISDAVQKFVTAGVLHPRGTDENATRKMIGWAELEEDELDTIDYTQKPAPAPVALVDEKGKPVKASAVLATAQQLSAALTENLYGPQKAA